MLFSTCHQKSERHDEACDQAAMGICKAVRKHFGYRNDLTSKTIRSSSVEYKIYLLTGCSGKIGFLHNLLQPLPRLHRLQIFCTTNTSRVLARERRQTFENSWKNTISNEHPVSSPTTTRSLTLSISFLFILLFVSHSLVVFVDLKRKKKKICYV